MPKLTICGLLFLSLAIGSCKQRGAGTSTALAADETAEATGGGDWGDRLFVGYKDVNGQDAYVGCRAFHKEFTAALKKLSADALSNQVDISLPADGEFLTARRFAKEFCEGAGFKTCTVLSAFVHEKANYPNKCQMFVLVQGQ